MMKKITILGRIMFTVVGLIVMLNLQGCVGAAVIAGSVVANEAITAGLTKNYGVEYSAYKYYRLANWSKAKSETTTSIFGVKQWICAPADEGRICVPPELYAKVKKNPKSLKNVRVSCRNGAEGGAFGYLLQSNKISWVFCKPIRG